MFPNPLIPINADYQASCQRNPQSSPQNALKLSSTVGIPIQFAASIIVAATQTERRHF